MTKPSINLQDLRRKIYLKAKTEPKWRFWGLYTHVCKMETLREAYKQCKSNKGSPGEDGLTFDAIENLGPEQYLKSIQEELLSRKYRTGKSLKVSIPKGNGKSRELSIPTIKDRIVQNSLKLILEPIFESDFQDGSYGSRPKKRAQEAVMEIKKSMYLSQTRVIDIDLQSYYDNIRHHLMLEKVGKRINDNEIMWLVKQILKSRGKKGLGQGSPISPLLANLYLNDVDKMLEKAKSVVNGSKYPRMSYARYMDDLVVCVSNHRISDWLYKGLQRRLKEEFAKIEIPINKEKSRIGVINEEETLEYLGFVYRRSKTRAGKQIVLLSPSRSKRTKLLQKLKEEMRRFRSQPITRVINKINPIVRGWVNYFRVGNSSRTFKYVREWLMRKIRRHLMRQRKRKGFGWKRWSSDFIYGKLNLYNDYKIRYIK